MKNILNKVEVDVTTYILIILALFAGYIKNAFIIIVIIMIHELGHVFFFRIFNIDIVSIKMYPFGGVTVINKKLHERIYKDILCSIGGLLFQIILGFIVYVLYSKGIMLETTYNLFSVYNESILFFNLIPIIPLDGSKLLFAIFSKYFSYKFSYILMTLIGVLSLIMFVIYNLLFKLNDLVLYVFLIIKLIEVIRDYKYVLNKFYLERVMYDHYYDGIVNNCCNLDKMRVNKFYFFKESKRYVNERDYIKREKFR